MNRAGALSDFKPIELAVAVFFAFAVMAGSAIALSSSALERPAALTGYEPTWLAGVAWRTAGSARTPTGAGARTPVLPRVAPARATRRHRA